MSKLEIRPQNMNEIAVNLGKKIEEWDNAVAKIYALHAELDTQFEGEARAKLDKIMEADRIQYNKLSEIMKMYANEISKAASDYVTADHDAALALKQ